MQVLESLDIYQQMCSIGAKIDANFLKVLLVPVSVESYRKYFYKTMISDVNH